MKKLVFAFLFLASYLSFAQNNDVVLLQCEIFDQNNSSIKGSFKVSLQMKEGYRQYDLIEATDDNSLKYSGSTQMCALPFGYIRLQFGSNEKWILGPSSESNEFYPIRYLGQVDTQWRGKCSAVENFGLVTCF